MLKKRTALEYRFRRRDEVKDTSLHSTHTPLMNLDTHQHTISESELKKLKDFFLFCRIAGDKATLTYVPTHIRMSSWMIGIIAGYIFTEYPKESIRVPSVREEQTFRNTNFSFK